MKPPVVPCFLSSSGRLKLLYDSSDEDDVGAVNLDENLMRLDTAGVERKPPLPTISLETLLAAAILISKIINDVGDGDEQDQDNIYQPDDDIRSLSHEKPPIPANHKS